MDSFNQLDSEELVTIILSRHGIVKYRDLFSQYKYNKSNMPKSCDHLIRPYSITSIESKVKIGFLIFF